MWAATRAINGRLALLPGELDRAIVWQALRAREQVRAWQEHAEEEAEEAADRRRFETEAVGRRPWWLVELSGAHLVWWASFIIVVAGVAEPRWEVPEAVIAVAVPVAIGGAVIKVFLPFMWWASVSRGTDKRNLIRYYRWWGRGWLPVLLALLPAVSAAVGWLISRYG
jgi:hypothetical protein